LVQLKTPMTEEEGRHYSFLFLFTLITHIISHLSLNSTCFCEYVRMISIRINKPPLHNALDEHTQQPSAAAFHHHASITASSKGRASVKLRSDLITDRWSAD